MFEVLHLISLFPFFGVLIMQQPLLFCRGGPWSACGAVSLSNPRLSSELTYGFLSKSMLTGPPFSCYYSSPSFFPLVLI